jgi:hypothetical protein
MKPRGHVLTALTTFTATALAAVLLLPSGVNAAGSTFVKIQDYKSKSNSGKAKVVANRLQVGDGSGALTVDGTVTAKAPGTTPLVLTCDVNVPTDSFQGCTMAVPAGRRFVVDTVSVIVDVANTSGSPAGWVRTKTNGVDREFYIPLVYQRTYAGGTLLSYVGQQLGITLFPDPGTNMIGFLARSGSGTASGRYTIAGHLE